MQNTPSEYVPEIIGVEQVYGWLPAKIIIDENTKKGLASLVTVVNYENDVFKIETLDFVPV